jgi:hypothetical protein
MIQAVHASAVAFGDVIANDAIGNGGRAARCEQAAATPTRILFNRAIAYGRRTTSNEHTPAAPEVAKYRITEQLTCTTAKDKPIDHAGWTFFSCKSHDGPIGKRRINCGRRRALADDRNALAQEVNSLLIGTGRNMYLIAAACGINGVLNSQEVAGHHQHIAVSDPKTKGYHASKTDR